MSSIVLTIGTQANETLYRFYEAKKHLTYLVEEKMVFNQTNRTTKKGLSQITNR